MKKISGLITLGLVLSLIIGCKKSEDALLPVSSAPTLVKFLPASGTAGTTVILTGNNFANNAAGNAVKFNGTAATVLAATDSSLTVSVPEGASTGKITVQVNLNIATSTENFTVNLPAPLVTFTGFSPATGTGGTLVTLTGTNFSTEIINNTVKFNGKFALVTEATPTALTVSAPESGSTGKITIQVGSETATSVTDFVYVTIASLTVSTLAGSGAFGFAEGAGTAAQFFQPTGVAVDAAGNVYVADAENHRIRKVTSGGVVSTLAGNGTAGFADGTGTSARFNSPRGITLDASGIVYIADGVNHSIRKITPAGVVTTVAGNGVAGFADGNGPAAQFFFPKGIAADALGNLYVADDINHRIRKVTPAGTVSTLAGSVLGSADGAGTVAKFNRPTGIAVDAQTNVYVADAENHRIRKITPNGTVSTLAGSTGGFSDGIGSAARFSEPVGVAVDGTGNVFVADSDNGFIRKITTDGTVSTLAGALTGFADGPASTARFRNPSGVTVDAAGKVYIADRLNHRIRKIQ